MDERRKKALAGGGRTRVEKQHQSGKQTARERIEMLLDKDTFVEVDGFVESRIDDFDLDKRRVPGDGVVTGYGKIDGRLVFVASEDRRDTRRIPFFQDMPDSGYGDADESAAYLY